MSQNVHAIEDVYYPGGVDLRFVTRGQAKLLQIALVKLGRASLIILRLNI